MNKIFEIQSKNWLVPWSSGKKLLSEADVISWIYLKKNSCICENIDYIEREKDDMKVYWKKWKEIIF